MDACTYFESLVGINVHCSKYNTSTEQRKYGWMRETANQSKLAETMHHIEVQFDQLAPSIDDVRWLSVSFALLWLVTVVWPHANGHKINGNHEHTAASWKSINRETKAESFWPFYVRASSSNIGTMNLYVLLNSDKHRARFCPIYTIFDSFCCRKKKKKTRRQRTEWKYTCQCRDKCNARIKASNEWDEICVSLRLLCVKLLLTDFECTIVLEFGCGRWGCERHSMFIDFIVVTLCGRAKSVKVNGERNWQRRPDSTRFDQCTLCMSIQQCLWVDFKWKMPYRLWHSGFFLVLYGFDVLLSQRTSNLT